VAPRPAGQIRRISCGLLARIAKMFDLPLDQFEKEWDRRAMKRAATRSSRRSSRHDSYVGPRRERIRRALLSRPSPSGSTAATP